MAFIIPWDRPRFLLPPVITRRVKVIIDSSLEQIRNIGRRDTTSRFPIFECTARNFERLCEFGLRQSGLLPDIFDFVTHFTHFDFSLIPALLGK